MIELLRGDFLRLKKDKIFWLSNLVMFLSGVILPLVHFFDMKRTGSDSYKIELDLGFFAYGIFVAILLSVFVSLFVGKEYSDGTIRNKIIVGKKRSEIYFSNLFTAVFAGFVMCSLYLIPYLAIGIPLLGNFEMGLKRAIVLMLCVFLLSCAFAAIFVLISMLCPNRAYTAVACILTALILILSGIIINSKLEEPEYYSAYSYELNGETFSDDAEKNPNYVSGTKRQIYEFIFNSTPGCQAYQLSGGNIEHPEQIACYSALFAILTTGAGLIFFRKKDLK